jgi:hypothetical protein
VSLGLRSLSTRFALVAISIIVVVEAVIGTAQFLHKRIELYEDLEEGVSRAVARLAETLVEPLWNLDALAEMLLSGQTGESRPDGHLPC